MTDESVPVVVLDRNKGLPEVEAVFGQLARGLYRFNITNDTNTLWLDVENGVGNNIDQIIDKKLIMPAGRSPASFRVQDLDNHYLGFHMRVFAPSVDHNLYYMEILISQNGRLLHKPVLNQFVFKGQFANGKPVQDAIGYVKLSVA